MVPTTRPEIVHPPDQPPERPLNLMEDAHLVQSALKGRDQAYEALVDRYTPVVVGFLYSRLGNVQDTEDVAQETFFSAYRHLGRLHKADSFGAWLMTIARGKMIDFCRKQTRQPRLLELNLSSAGAVPDPLEAAPSRDASPRDQATFSETQMVVLREIEKMGEKYRMLLYCRLIGEESVAEIALRLGIKENAIRMRLFRGMKLLRKSLKKYGIEPTEK